MKIFGAIATRDVAISERMFFIEPTTLLAAMTMTGIQAARSQYLPLLWPIPQLGAAVKPNDVTISNVMTSHCSILFLSLFLPWLAARMPK